jgi:hypothetical protein
MPRKPSVARLGQKVNHSRKAAPRQLHHAPFHQEYAQQAMCRHLNVIGESSTDRHYNQDAAKRYLTLSALAVCHRLLLPEKACHMAEPCHQKTNATNSLCRSVGGNLLQIRLADKRTISGMGLTQSLSLFITSGLMEAIKFSCIFVSMAPGLKDRI